MQQDKQQDIREADARFMREALSEARRAASLGEVPVGAVVARAGRVIARACNRRELDGDPSAHAEFSALVAAAHELGRWRLSDCTVYVTLEPCPMCAGLMVNARVGRCVFGAADAKAGALGSVLRLQDDSRLNHAFPVTAGVLADECSAVLRAFFAERRGGLAASLAGDHAHELARDEVPVPVVAESLPIAAAPPLRVAIAMDSFKCCASSSQVEAWVTEGVRRAEPEARVVCLPVADGGEGTVEAVLAARPGELRHVTARGPLGGERSAAYARFGTEALIESASAAGISLSPCTDEAACRASTAGVGDVVRAAIAGGAERIYLGLGGVCTNDGGAGFLQALGARLLDAAGVPIPPGLDGLAQLDFIDLGPAAHLLDGVELIGLTDVRAPLLGARGALAVFGPQKGLADPAAHHGTMVAYAQLLSRAFERSRRVGDASCRFRSLAGVPGAGAAGGLGAALLALGGALVSGADTVLDLVGFDDAVVQADLVITGEGHIDAQTAEGKAPVVVAARAKRSQKPVIALVGGCAEDLSVVYKQGIDLVLPVTREPMDRAQALEAAEARVNLACAGEAAVRAYRLRGR